MQCNACVGHASAIVSVVVYNCRQIHVTERQQLTHSVYSTIRTYSNVTCCIVLSLLVIIVYLVVTRPPVDHTSTRRYHTHPCGRPLSTSHAMFVSSCNGCIVEYPHEAVSMSKRDGMLPKDVMKDGGPHGWSPPLRPSVARECSAFGALPRIAPIWRVCKHAYPAEAERYVRAHYHRFPTPSQTASAIRLENLHLRAHPASDPGGPGETPQDAAEAPGPCGNALGRRTSRSSCRASTSWPLPRRPRSRASTSRSPDE